MYESVFRIRIIGPDPDPLQETLIWIWVPKKNRDNSQTKQQEITYFVILGRIRIHYPGSGSADPDPHQNETDPKHWYEQ